MLNMSGPKKVFVHKVINKTLTQIVKEQHWISRSPEGQGHNNTCWWHGLDLSDNVCEHEVNQLTNEKVITEKQNFNTNC